MNANAAAPNEETSGSPAGARALSGGGSPPYDGSIEQRLSFLEVQFGAILPTLATKSDIGDVRGEIVQLHAEALVEMHELRVDFLAEIRKVRTDFEKFSLTIMKWMVATVISLFIGFAGVFYAMNNMLRPAPAPLAVPAPSGATVPGKALFIGAPAVPHGTAMQGSLLVPPTGIEPVSHA